MHIYIYTSISHTKITNNKQFSGTMTVIKNSICGSKNVKGSFLASERSKKISIIHTAFTNTLIQKTIT